MSTKPTQRVCPRPSPHIIARFSAFVWIVWTAVAAQAQPTSFTGEVFVHDPSTIAKCGGEYWLFATGFGLASHHSRDLVHWQRGPRVFERAPAWTSEAVPGNRSYFWAPDVIQSGGRYLLYYSVSRWGTNTSVIGLATNPTLDPADARFRWTDEGPVIRSYATNDFNAIDPNLFADADGRLWLAFGSFWSGIKLIEMNPTTGKRLAPDSPMHSLATHASIEAVALHRHGGDYFLFVNWGNCCRGTNSTYEIRVGRSRSVTGPFLDRDGVDLVKGGGTPFLESRGRFIGPGHAAFLNVGGTERVSFHFYDSANRGRATLGILPLRWSADGWPEVTPAEK
jgi:arabinan endo-1,5-alpha-L-arabinosidase